MSVQCCTQDLHSGVLGGTVHEAMTDLIALMGTLVESSTGKILVDGVMDDVRPVTADEEALYDVLDFDVQEFANENKIITGKLLHNDKKSLLMHRWRYPTLSLHGIEGAFSGVGAKTVIPAKAIGKFSLRLVPDQDPKRIERLVKDHVTKKFNEVRLNVLLDYFVLLFSPQRIVFSQSDSSLFVSLCVFKLGSPNILNVEMIHGAKAWLSSPKHPNYEAAAAAIEKV
jgi:cytosolic nonspecific dipeptidase